MKMSDEEFQQKVEELRKEMMDLVSAKIGGQDKLASEDMDEFMDAYSLGIYATLSTLSTLANVFMTQHVVSGKSIEDSVKITSHIYHGFLHEVLDTAQETMVDSLEYVKKLKTMN